jgi:fucose permease
VRVEFIEPRRWRTKGRHALLIYGVAKDKLIIFIAAALSAFVGMSFPTISALKSNNVVRFVYTFGY